VTTQNIRFFLFAAVGLIGMLLYNAWQQDYPTKPAVMSSAIDAKDESPSLDDQEIPTVLAEKNKPEEKTAATTVGDTHRYIQVKTDVFNLKIDTVGGDITHLILSDYAESQESYGEGYVLFDESATRYYVAQSGLTGEQGPDKRGVGRAKYHAAQPAFQLSEKDSQLFVDLHYHAMNHVDVTKRFIFNRGSYVIEVEYIVDNKGTQNYTGNFYARLKRQPSAEKGGGFLGIQTFTGAAVHTQDTPYKKLNFKDIAEKPFEQSVKGGWAAMVEHYFVSAWIPNSEATNVYQAKEIQENIYMVGLVEPVLTVLPGEHKSIKTKLYAGPEITEDLEPLAPGLDLAVDYGILWPICQPIFWLLKKLFQLTQNWGAAIILVTVVIKLLFYKLSASSYRSMGNMRKLQPKMEALKERYGEDKQKFSQAVMELYKKEKINPLGGCFPVLIQIPVFIALYYVLLGSVELREAPFIFWITDLSAKDPYYVLPILMGASMLIQQKLNPAPPDPVQAKVMMFMPVVFTALFLSFPSGLVLYWFVNNVLSILQQWVITRKIEATSKGHGAK